MDKQKQIFEKLGFGPFLANRATILFLPRKEKDDVFYASANYKVQEPNFTRPDDHRTHFEHDVIMTVVHCGERTDKGRVRHKIVNRCVVSIEIKTSTDDIWRSSIDKYLGATRLFFIAAPKTLLHQVILRYRSHPRKDGNGLYLQPVLGKRCRNDGPVAGRDNPDTQLGLPPLDLSDKGNQHRAQNPGT